VVAESVALLGDPADTVAFREDVIPAADSRGRFYLVDRGGALVHVFGSDGRLMLSFGKAGRGPGEFSGLRLILVAPGDTLLVIGASVVHVVSPEYAHVREYRTGGGDVDEFSSTLLADRRILLGRSAHDFALVASEGVAQTRVTLRGIDTARCGECGERIFREARVPGAVWSAPLNAYRIEKHDLTGTLLRRYSRNPEWFRPWGPREIAADEIVVELGRPRIWGVREDSHGLLWVHTTLVEHPEELGQIDEDNARQMAALWARVITRIDAIDDSTGKFLGGTTVAGMAVPLNHHDYTGQLVVDESGDWSWRILRFRVQRPMFN
jgi:hypothetical protein